MNTNLQLCPKCNKHKIIQIDNEHVNYQCYCSTMNFKLLNK